MPSRKDNRKTPVNRSKKAHMAQPPKKLAPHVAPQQAEARDIGQFTGAGSPGLEKK